MTQTRRFNRDFALVNENFPDWNPNWLVAESHNYDRLCAMRDELNAEGFSCVVMKSDLPRSRAA